MSIDSLKAFWERAGYDPALQARLRSIKAETSAQAIAEVVQIASEFGFAFSSDEYLVGLPAVQKPAPKVPQPPSYSPNYKPPPGPPQQPNFDCCGHKMDC